MMWTERSITPVVLIENQDEYRQHLQFFINADEAMECQAFAECGQALSYMEHDVPAVVVMDVLYPEANGIEIVREIKRRWHSVQVIIYTTDESDECIQNALRAGAIGYLLKKAPIERLKEGIRQVQKGGSPMSPTIARRVISYFQPTPSDDVDALTAREQEVLEMLSTDLNTCEIGAKLFVSNNTLRTHLRHIYEKLHVHTRLEAVKKGKGIGT